MNPSIRIANLLQWYNDRTLRERIILLCALVIVLFVLVQMIVIEPLTEKATDIKRKIGSSTTAITELKARKMVLEQQQNRDPNRDQLAKLEILQRESEKLQQQLSATIDNLVMPEQMTALLRDMLKRQQGLILLRLKNLPAEKIDLLPPSAEEKSSVLYRHMFEMELRGNYRGLLGYLRILEALPREIGWEAVEIETREYPQALIKMKVFTLSLREEWIGG